MALSFFCNTNGELLVPKLVPIYIIIVVVIVVVVVSVDSRQAGATSITA